VKITIDMEPRELHEVLMLAAATFGPDEPPKPPMKVHSKRIAKKGGSHGYTDNLPAPTKEIRQWAKDAGFHVAKGGTLPKDVIDAYKEAM